MLLLFFLSLIHLLYLKFVNFLWLLKMFHRLFRLYSFSMFTFLRVGVALTNNVYFMMMDVFSIMDDVLRANVLHPNPNSISNANRNNTRQIPFTNNVRPSSRQSQTSTTSTQTEECIKIASNDREQGSKTDIFIYNLDASKKLIITHENIDSNSIIKSDKCRSSKQNKHSRTKSLICDSSSQSLIETAYSSSSQYSSNMSLENDVSGGHILQFSLLTKAEEGNDRSRPIEENKYRNCDNSNSKIDCDEFEIDLQEKELLQTKQENITCIQKTSSPIKMSSFSFIDPCKKLENSIKRKRCDVKDIQTKTSDESSISDGEKTATNFETTILLDDSARRRLSLPASFNTSNKSAAHFEAIKNEIEESIKNTSRHEKSIREIKYPLNEIFLTKDNEESKEVFSCSSYESLPLSEHLHNAFEKSTFFSLYREDLISTSTPDFSSVDEFVEAFNKMKSTLSVSELVMNRNTSPFFCPHSKSEVKFKSADSYEILETKNSEENYSVAHSKVSNNKYTTEEMQHKYNVNDDELAVKPNEKKFDSSTNSVDLISDKCVSSSPLERDTDSCKNSSRSDEESEEINQLIKSLFDKILDSEDNNLVNVHEKYGINDNQIKLDCESKEGNFIKRTKDCSFQSNSTKPQNFQQDLNLKQSQSSETAEDFKENNSQAATKICEKQTAINFQKLETVQKRYELENTDNTQDLHTDETSKFQFPKQMTCTETDTKISENSKKIYESFNSVTKRENEFTEANESGKMQPDEDSHENIIMKRDKICRNDSSGHDIFVSFVEENSFHDTNLEDFKRTSEPLICK